MLVTDAFATALTKLSDAGALRDDTLRGHSRTLARQEVQVSFPNAGPDRGTLPQRATIVRRMGEPDDQPAIQLDDGESNRLHAVWSRSRKHLIVSVAPRANWGSAGQVELTPEQVATLRDFLAEIPQ